MATLINGDGNAAVYAAQDADWFAGVEGNVTKILNIGLKMAYEIEDANTIAVKNGVIVTQEGRRIQIDAGSIDEFTIPTGSQGVTKYYIIGYHLYTDASSNQLCETFVQLMANDTDTIPEDTFRGGSDEVYVSLYRVTQDGITLSTVQSLLPEAATVKDIEDDIAGINASLTEFKIDKVEGRAMSWVPSHTTYEFQITLGGLTDGWILSNIQVWSSSLSYPVHISSIDLTNKIATISTDLGQTSGVSLSCSYIVTYAKTSYGA